MKIRLFLAIALSTFSCVICKAVTPAIHSIDIDVCLQDDGSGRVTEIWDVVAASGTEWYLVKDNLSGMTLSDFSVSEDGIPFRNIGNWDINADIDAKSGKCGIVSKSDGYELCWGIGNYGRHTFTVNYILGNLVQSMSDYDKLHFQFVSPGLSSRPGKVRLTISAEDRELGTDNSRLWGFGFEGQAGFADGKAVFKSEGSFSGNSSVIVLMRFDKGLFHPLTGSEGSFQDILDRALEGSDFSHMTLWESIMEFLMVFGPFLLFILISMAGFFGSRINKKKYLGVQKMSDIGWVRDIPFGGNLLETDFVLEKLGQVRKSNSAASAMILKMIKNGQLLLGKDSRGKVEISFNDSADMTGMYSCEKELYMMMKDASGSDRILQDKEFSRWSSMNTVQVERWSSSVMDEAAAHMKRDGYYVSSRKLSTSGQEQARNVLGFRKYLEDFTIINEREAVEVNLWQDYLIFAALFGIADKVAKELKDINPEAYEQVMHNDFDTTINVIYMSDGLSRAITNAVMDRRASKTSRAVGGFGGPTSFGGGGGFSGGGFGGGSR